MVEPALGLASQRCDALAEVPEHRCIARPRVAIRGEDRCSRLPSHGQASRLLVRGFASRAVDLFRPRVACPHERRVGAGRHTSGVQGLMQADQPHFLPRSGFATPGGTMRATIWRQQVSRTTNIGSRWASRYRPSGRWQRLLERWILVAEAWIFERGPGDVRRGRRNSCSDHNTRGLPVRRIL
jgi:hypothetical protein